MEWRDPSTGQIKTWVWVVAAGGLVLIFLLLSRGQRQVEGTTVTGQSSDMTEYLTQLNESILALTEIIGTGNVPPPNTTPPPTTTPPPNNTTPLPDVTHPTFTTYTVKSGDTLIRIANQFDTTYKKIWALNTDLITDPNKIKAGWVIKIPT